MSTNCNSTNELTKTLSLIKVKTKRLSLCGQAAVSDIACCDQCIQQSVATYSIVSACSTQFHDMCTCVTLHVRLLELRCTVDLCTIGVPTWRLRFAKLEHPITQRGKHVRQIFPFLWLVTFSHSHTKILAPSACTVHQDSESCICWLTGCFGTMRYDSKIKQSTEG